ncbi:AAA family ATPase [Pseudomonas protegens]|uniref:ATP-dependent nuclease n=1 Tax=Pseudomonas protegens TaxID=380021 RepID=UPI001C8E5D70|nr:ATP-binding protein [Pseudomonas protegens]QZI69345.1 AAA family ATPase [Pseudomonas protegens]
MHIKSFGLLGIRRLHLNNTMQTESLNPRDVHQYAASKINIFVGPNGGGKSTLLDMVRALKDADLIKTVARENMQSTTASMSVINFEGGTRVVSAFNKLDINEFGTAIYVITPAGTHAFEGSIYSNSSKPPKNLVETLKKLPVEIRFRNSHDEHGVSTQRIISALNSDGKHLVGLAPHPLQPNQATYVSSPSQNHTNIFAQPISHIKNNLLGVYLNDDLSQFNHIPMEMLPSGWRAFAGLIGWLNSLNDNQICVIEEPEVHLHPTLQRLMMTRVSEIVARKNLQLFISTHSSVLLDLSSWSVLDTRLFEVNGYALAELTSPARALAGLGIKPSDVFQANGVIWVEGASDRIYILNWLSEWCSMHSKTMPVENLDFSFVLYGGSTLGHFTSSAAPGLIDIFSINRNSIVIMDRDLDFQRAPDGTDICINQDCVKYQVWTDIAKQNSKTGYCWVTEGYTIESYLPSAFLNTYYQVVNSRLTKTSYKSKVAIATQFVGGTSSFNGSYDPATDLPNQIEKLFKVIEAWKL